MTLREKFINKAGFNPTGLHKMKLPPPPPPPKEEVYTFSANDRDDNVLFGNNNTVKAGTLEKLVERLTSEKYPDPPFRQAFLLTYRTFTTPNQFLNILKARYNMQRPESMEISQWEKQLKAIRLKVVNVLRQWVQKGFYDFVDNTKLRKNFFQFLEEMTELPGAAKNLQSIFEREEQEARNNRNITFGDRKPPTPIVPKIIAAIPSILDFHPEEIARQLTLIESSLYRAIKPWECLNQSWSKKDKDKRAPRILAMINRFNTVSNWFAAEVLRPEPLKQRIAVLKHIIDIGDKCLSLNNFNAVMEVVSGLQNSSVFRLKQTWGGLEKTRYVKMFDEQREVMLREQNYKNFRDNLHKVNPPCIPYLGVYLTDLTFIEDGNQDLTGNLINFVKRQMVSEVIAEIQQYQDTPYCLERVEAIAVWLERIDIMSESDMYKISLERESKGSGNKQAGRKRTLTKQLLPKPEKERKRESAMTPAQASIFSSPYGELEEIKGYRFYEKDSENNIIMEEIKEDDRIVIKAGSLPKLVERLTYEKYPDTNYLFAFLMTYKTFTTANELLDLLIMRFNMPHPKNPTKDQVRLFKSEKLVPIHFRVFNVLKNWVEKYYIDFKQDTVLVQRVLDFVEKATESQVALEKVGTQIKNTLNNKKMDMKNSPIFGIGEAAEKMRSSMNKSVDTPSVTLTQILENSIDCVALAEQLYHNTHTLFTLFGARECMQKLWCSPEAKVKSPNIFYLRRNFKFLQRWVFTEIITSPDIKSRATITEYFIIIAEKLMKLKDYQDCVAIIQAISKLKDKELIPTWEWIQPKYIHLFNRIYHANPKADFTDQRRKTPHIPYLEDDIDKLESIHDSMNDNVGNNNDLINFEKRQAIYSIFANICVERNDSLDPNVDKIEPNPTIQNFLINLNILTTGELTDLAETMNNERPEGIPPTQKSNEHEKQVTEENIYEVFHEQIYSLMEEEETKQSILGLVNESKDIFVDILKEEIVLYQEYTKQFLLIELAYSGGYSYAMEIVRSCSIKILEKKFPGAKVEHCSIESSPKQVYFTVQDEDSNWIRFLTVTESITVPTISKLKSAFDTYTQENNLQDSPFLYPSLVGFDVLDVDSLSFANEEEIQLIIL